MDIQIACEIDIRTLTSHQVFGQFLGQIFDQILGQFWGIRKYSVQFYWDRKYSVQFYWDRKYSVQFDWDRNRLHANYYCLFRAYQKTGYPLSIHNIVKRYLFVSDYTLNI